MRALHLSLAAACVVGFTSLEARADGDLPPLANPTPAPSGQQTVIIVQQGPAAPTKPKKIPVVDGEDPPPGYHRDSTSIKGLWIAGITVLSVGYVFTILGGGVQSAVDGNNKYVYESLIPGAGPWIILAQNDAAAPYWVITGVLQAGGIGMLIGGLAGRRETWIRDDVGDLHLSPKRPPIQIEPLVGVGNLGMRMRF